jgi:hypothetical protein
LATIRLYHLVYLLDKYITDAPHSVRVVGEIRDSRTTPLFIISLDI